MSLMIAMCLFAFSMSISPGPVNLIVLSSGVNFGARQTMPFVLGAVLGFVLLLLVVGFGLGAIATQSPAWLTLFCLAGNGFIFYLGSRLFLASDKVTKADTLLPTFNQGMILQWLNPKAWVACVAGVSAFNLINSPAQLLVFVSLYFVVCLLSMASWAVAGDKISRYLTDNRRMRIFNRVMGGLLMLLALYLAVAYLVTTYN